MSTGRHPANPARDHAVRMHGFLRGVVVACRLAAPLHRHVGKYATRPCKVLRLTPLGLGQRMIIRVMSQRWWSDRQRATDTPRLCIFPEAWRQRAV